MLFLIFGQFILMATFLFFLQDFATPSLTEENTVNFTDDNAELERREIKQFQLRRSWESR